jgi:hypothetical protein
MKGKKPADRNRPKWRAHATTAARSAKTAARRPARMAAASATASARPAGTVARRATVAKGAAAVGGHSKAKKASRRSRSAPRRASVSDEVVLEAAVLRRLLKHFDERKDVQNIELMILAGFCRNCLSKWLVEAAAERGLEVDIERAREKIYGMPYDEWKSRYQQPATEDQLRRFAAAEQRTHAPKQ